MNPCALRVTAVTAVAVPLLLAPSAAWAATAYPPTVPGPTVSGTKVGPAPTVQGTKVSADTEGSALPRTGTEVMVWVLSGGALVAAGVGLVAAGRRRGRHV